ncbi:MAG: preprotein translocase subunit YajC, partial [Spirochaetales bacterium]|nr:preprotein translocase subunit YajC [Spirochaetales bacterium]
IRGTVAVVKDSTVIIKVDDNTRIEFNKNAISAVLNKKEESVVEKPAKKSADKEKIEKVEKPAVEAPKADEKAEEPAEKA